MAVGEVVVLSRSYTQPVCVPVPVPIVYGGGGEVHWPPPEQGVVHCTALPPETPSLKRSNAVRRKSASPRSRSQCEECEECEECEDSVEECLTKEREMVGVDTIDVDVDADIYTTTDVNTDTTTDTTIDTTIYTDVNLQTKLEPHADCIAVEGGVSKPSGQEAQVRVRGESDDNMEGGDGDDWAEVYRLYEKHVAEIGIMV